jgi:hypothetical protein
MRFIAWLLLTAAPIGVLSLLPSPAELEAPMTAQAELGRIELERWRAVNSQTSAHTTTTTEFPEPVVAPPVTLPPTTTTTTTLPDIRCVEWWNAAVVAGWPTDLIPTLLNDIVWAESRCQPDATNGSDHGLAQINWRTWSDFVESMGLRLDHLYQPELNLRVAYLVSVLATEYGWRWCQPWDSSGNHC